jgi:hypothetical protein
MNLGMKSFILEKFIEKPRAIGGAISWEKEKGTPLILGT